MIKYNFLYLNLVRAAKKYTMAELNSLFNSNQNINPNYNLINQNKKHQKSVDNLQQIYLYEESITPKNK